MQSKTELKTQAVRLRQKGLSYSEILKKIHVSKSTLSLWLKPVSLIKSQLYRLEYKQRMFRQFGAETWHKQSLEKISNIRKSSISEVGKIGSKEIFIAGVMLYWAEGAKARGNNISQGVEFSNSDPRMCKFFLKWVRQCLEIPENRISYSVYIHQSSKSRVEEVANFWSKFIEIPITQLAKIYFTSTVYPRKRKRKENGNYYGQLRIKIRKSTDLNRKIAGWVEGVCLQT